MSRDWNVACLDCKSVDRYNDANHREELMRAIAKNSSAIAALAPLMAELPHGDIELRTFYGSVDVDWHVRHNAHKLVIISEYGDLEDLDGSELGRVDWAWSELG